jgi:glycolate oxidase
MVRRQQELLVGYCAKRGLGRITAAKDGQREILWELRRSISPSLARMGITKINEDVSVPLGRLGEAVGWIHGLAVDYGLRCYIFGHCGDGNLHVNIMTDRRNKGEMERAEKFVARLFEGVAGMGGTLSGEHGIGMTKGSFLDIVYSSEEMRIQRRLERAMDGSGMLNPGKYFGSQKRE